MATAQELSHCYDFAMKLIIESSKVSYFFLFNKQKHLKIYCFKYLAINNNIYISITVKIIQEKEICKLQKTI